MRACVRAWLAAKVGETEEGTNDSVEEEEEKAVVRRSQPGNLGAVSSFLF